MEKEKENPRDNLLSFIPFHPLHQVSWASSLVSHTTSHFFFSLTFTFFSILFSTRTHVSTPSNPFFLTPLQSSPTPFSSAFSSHKKNSLGKPHKREEDEKREAAMCEERSNFPPLCSSYPPHKATWDAYRLHGLVNIEVSGFEESEAAEVDISHGGEHVPLCLRLHLVHVPALELLLQLHHRTVLHLSDLAKCLRHLSKLEKGKGNEKERKEEMVWVS